MPANDLVTTVASAIEHRRLLTHPFYERWQNGAVERYELTAYAEQYRHIEAALPHALADLVETLPPSKARGLVEQNLSDELSNPCAHLALFDEFAEAFEADTAAAPTAATRALVELYREDADAVTALATIAAYELQASEIACSKADGLRQHYGLSTSQTRFWDVHGEIESHHANWTIDALESLGADSEVVFDAARRSADAWWAFLDERELAANS